MKRRSFLKVSSGAALLAAKGLDPVNFIGSAVAGGAASPPFDLAAHQPLEIKSLNGVLSLNLSCELSAGKLIVNGNPVNLRTYNSMLPGYTLIAHPGDVLKVNLVNNFPSTPDDFVHPADMNVPHGLNVTNLHVHGLNVSPEGNQDAVLLDLYPGETFSYAIQIPLDHPTGTFWYHPHKHGSSMRQMASGMSGFLIIEGPGDLNSIPEIKAATTVNIAFQELILQYAAPDGTLTTPSNAPPGATVGLPSSLNPTHDLFAFAAKLQYTVNGLAVDEGANAATGVPATPPVLYMRPGEVQRWRFATMAHLQTYKLVLQDHQFQVVAWDGITANEISVFDENTPLVIGPGSRVDIVVKASTTPGTYPMYLLNYQFGEFPLFVTPNYGESSLVAFNVVVQGAPLPMSLPTQLNPPSLRLPYVLPSEVSRKRTVVFRVTGDVVFDGATNAFVADNRQFYVNGLKFSANRINQTVLLNSAEEWTIINRHESNNQALMINHPFHIHVNWILLIEIQTPDGNGGFIIEKPNNGYGIWMDNIDVPHGGQVTFRTRFQNFTGIFPFHCHVLAHEDEGMMQLVEVVDPAPVTATIGHAGGVLASTDVLKRVNVKFNPGNFAQNTPVSYYFNLDPQSPAPFGLVGLERYFRLQTNSVLTGTATITINFPLEVPGGETFASASVKLYRSTGSGWTTAGITTLSLDAANGVLVSTVNTLGNGYFAVFATMLTGPVSP